MKISGHKKSERFLQIYLHYTRGSGEEDSGNMGAEGRHAGIGGDLKQKPHACRACGNPRITYIKHALI
jgi:hypothetical protein